jgi:transposase-like protein
MLGDDFPKSLIEFEEIFGTEEQCRNHLFHTEFPNGFICPKCGKKEFWWTARNLMHCKTCHHQESLRTGTVFEGSKKPLRLWYRVLYFVAVNKNGISALAIKRLMGFGSYQTAWAWLHKIRRAMIRQDREKLEGSVEVDETYLGGTKKGKRGRGAEGKALVCIALEKKAGEKKPGRVRIEVIPDISGESILGFIQRNVIEGSTIRSDGLPSYRNISENGYQHDRVIEEKEKPESMMPALHLVISLMKRWIIGTMQGRVSEKHLPQYLDEFVFRFNRRTSKNRGKVYFRALDQCTSVRSTPYWKLVGRKAADIPLKASA